MAHSAPFLLFLIKTRNVSKLKKKKKKKKTKVSLSPYFSSFNLTTHYFATWFNVKPSRTREISKRILLFIREPELDNRPLDEQQNKREVNPDRQETNHDYKCKRPSPIEPHSLCPRKCDYGFVLRSDQSA